MNDLITTVLILAIVGFIATLFAGATNKVVIFFDKKDLAVSAAPWGCLLGSLLLVAFYESRFMHALVLIPATLGALFFSYRSIVMSIYYNKNTKLGIAVGIFKIVAAGIGIFVLLSKVKELQNSGGSLKNAALAVAALAALAWVGTRLINGKKVYLAKGWPMPDQADLEIIAETPTAGQT